MPNNLKKLQKRTSGTEALTIADVDGLYNQSPLFDLCSDDAIVSFTLVGGYNRALDIIGFENSNEYLIKRNFLTYIAPSGTAAGEPVSSDHSAACEPGTGVEAGGCGFQLTGWGRMRKSSDTRDITDIPQRYCKTIPTYNIAGQMIADDYEWDIVRLTTVMLQDLQRRVIDGNKSVAGQADGLLQLIKYGYTDPDSGELCTSMDSTVIDYGENAMLSDTGATGVTFNGNAVADGYNLYDYIASFLRRTRLRISNSSMSGMPVHYGLIPTEHLNCLIDAWVCHTHCGGEKSQMMESEVQAILNKLKNDLMSSDTVTLAFHGVAVTFLAYDYGLITGATDPGGVPLATILILTTNIGNTPLMRIQMKNMAEIANHPATAGAEFMVSDNSRLLSWTTVDHTCYRVHTELQWRLLLSAPWAQMKIENVPCSNILGSWSVDPLSEHYVESNLVAYPKATSSTFTPQSAPVAQNQFGTTLINTPLVVAAGSGLLTGATGYPAPTATAVVGAATTDGGTITITADGAYTYTPPSATYTGVDTYVFTVTNAVGSDTATLTVVVYEENA